MAYNPASQITTRSGAHGLYAWQAHGNGSTSSTTNGLNQLVTQGGASISHDARGNVTGDGVRSFAYTAENRLAQSGSVLVAHDPAGWLSQVSGGAGNILFDAPGGTIVSERTGSYALLRRYVHGPGVDEPLVWYEGSGTSDRRLLHADERGSIVAVTDINGAAMGINKYDEHGKPQGPAIQPLEMR